jgi:hypothetical protein
VIYLCGLRVINIGAETVPPSLRFGRNSVVVNSKEFVELAQDAAPGASNRNGKISALLEAHDKYLLGQAAAVSRLSLSGL